MNPAPEAPDDTSSSNGRLWWTATLMVAAIAVFFVAREHWQHLLGYWSYLLLLACPILHLFHRHGHGQGRSEHTHSSSNNR